MLASLLPQIGAWPLAELAAVLGALWLAAIMLASWRPRAPLEYMIGASAALEGLQVGKVHVFTGLCVLYVIADFHRPVEFRWPAFAVIAAAGILAVTSLTGDLVNSKTLGIQLVALAASAAVVATKADADSARRMAIGLLAMCAFGSAIGIGQRIGIVPYTPFTDPNQLGRVKGIWHEPDWMGMYSAMGLLLAFRLSIRSSWQTVLVVVLTGALVLSLARAAWVALLVAALVAWAVSNRGVETSARRRRNRRVLAATALAAGLILTVNVSLRDYAVQRVGALVGTHQRDIAVQARSNQNASLMVLAKSAPWNGHGLSAAGRVNVFGGINYGVADNNVASNWVLGWWIDGKFLAVSLIVLLLGIAAAGRRNTGGLLLILVLVASLASNAMLVPAPWFAFGLAVAGMRGRVFESLVKVRDPRVQEVV